MKTEALRAIAHDLKYNLGVLHSNPQLILEESFISGVKYGQSNPKIKQLEWCEEQCLNENIPYNHVKALSPLGVYTVEWKGWKDYDDKTIFLDGVFVSMGGFVLEDAKILAQADFERRVMECLDL